MICALGDFWSDVFRIFHLLFFAVGATGSLYAEGRALQRINSATTGREYLELVMVHKIIVAAMIGMWITGTALIYDKTMFMTEFMTPKLYMKLGVVTLLTINAMVIGAIYLPHIKRSKGAPFTSFARSMQLPMVASGVVSFAGWLLALYVATAGSAQMMDWTDFARTSFLFALVVLTVPFYLVPAIGWVFDTQTAEDA